MTPPDFLAELFRAITAFHDLTIRRHGGLPGFRDAGLLRLAIERPWMTAGGEPIYKTSFQKAAAMAEAIVRTHPFNDGNHRTSLAAAELLLGLHSIKVVAMAEEKRDTIRNLGSGRLGLDDFAAWLERNSILRSGPLQ